MDNSVKIERNINKGLLITIVFQSNRVFFFLLNNRANILEKFDTRDRIKLDFTKNNPVQQSRFSKIMELRNSSDETSSSKIPLVDSTLTFFYV